MDKLFLKIAVIVISIIVLVVIIVPVLLYQLDSDLPIITYVCITGFTPDGFSAWRSHNNGTHFIDMDSCKWERIPIFDDSK